MEVFLRLFVENAASVRRRSSGDIRSADKGAAKLRARKTVHSRDALKLAAAELRQKLRSARIAYFSKDHGRSRALLLPLAKRGIAEAQHMLAQMCRSGQGAEPDLQEAARWCRLAAEQRSPAAQAELGIMYLQAHGLERDVKLGVYWLELAALNGSKFAQISLGEIYEIGEVVVTDFRVAARWRRLAAKNGDTVSQFKLGLQFLEGRGVSKSYKRAAKWLRLAASGRSEGPEFKLGRVCEEGDFGPRSFREAAHWYRCAAKHRFLQLTGGRDGEVQNCGIAIIVKN